MPEFLDTAPVLSDTAEVKRRLDRDGYLFIRGLLGPDVLEPVRLMWLRLARDAGWVDTSAPLADAVADPNGFCLEPQDPYMAVMLRVYARPEYHAIAHHPNLMGLFERILGDDILPHAIVIGRTIFPQRTAYTTPAHQDWIPIQGCDDTFTAWIPMSDLADEMGGLEINAGSHLSGIYNFKPALGAGAIAITDPLDETRWMHGTMRQGDVIIFHSLTVHRGRPNTGKRLRLSIDARFQRVSDPVAPKSLRPGMVTWEELYKDWPADHELKYYWRKWDLNFKAYDSSYMDKRDQMAFAMAEANDHNALAALERIVARDPNPEKRERAEALLEQIGEPND